MILIPGLNATLSKKIVDFYQGPLVSLRRVNRSFRDYIDSLLETTGHLPHLSNPTIQLALDTIKRNENFKSIHIRSVNKFFYRSPNLHLAYDIANNIICFKQLFKTGMFIRNVRQKICRTLLIKEDYYVEFTTHKMIDSNKKEIESHYGTLTYPDLTIEGNFDERKEIFLGKVKMVGKTFVYEGYSGNQEPKKGTITFANGFTWRGWWINSEPEQESNPGFQYLMTDETIKLVEQGKCILESKEIVQGSFNYDCKECNMNFCESCRRNSETCFHRVDICWVPQPQCGTASKS